MFDPSGTFIIACPEYFVNYFLSNSTQNDYYVKGGNLALRLGRSRVNEFLKKRGYSQLDLALHLNVTEGYISQVCNSTANLSVFKMKKTARFLGCKMDDLIDWDEEIFK